MENPLRLSPPINRAAWDAGLPLSCGAPAVCRALEIITEAGLYTHNIFSHEKAQFNILRNFTLHKKHPLLNKRYGLKSGTTVDRGSVAS